MTSYKITHTPDTLGAREAVTKWFTDKAEAKRYAKTVIRHGYFPTVTEHGADDFVIGKPVTFPRVSLFAFFRAVDA